MFVPFTVRGRALLILVALTLAGCARNGPAASSGAAEASVSHGVVEISAEGAAFNVTSVRAAAGEPFTIQFTNRDRAGHNVAVYTEAGEVVVRGDIINGPNATTEVEVPALDRGTYLFRCDPHAGRMSGSLVVEG